MTFSQGRIWISRLLLLRQNKMLGNADKIQSMKIEKQAKP